MIVRDFFQKFPKSLRKQFFQYVIVGGIASVFDIGILFVFTDYFGFYYLVSTAVGFFVGLIVNQILCVKFIFNQRYFKNRWVEKSVLIGIGLFGLLFTELLMWFFVSVIGLYYIYSKIWVMIVVLILNFFARRYILFRARPSL